MTDWLPWGFVVMVGTFATQYLTLRSLSRTPVGTAPDLRYARIALWITILLSLAVFALYVFFGESWVWYLR